MPTVKQMQDSINALGATLHQSHTLEYAGKLLAMELERQLAQADVIDVGEAETDDDTDNVLAVLAEYGI